MAMRIELAREYLMKALDIAETSATRASNQRGVNPLIKEIHLKDAKAYADAKTTISEIK